MATTHWKLPTDRKGYYIDGYGKGDRWGRSHGSGGLSRFPVHNINFVQSLVSNIVYTLRLPNT